MSVPFSLLRSALPDIPEYRIHVSDIEHISHICLDHTRNMNDHETLYLCREDNTAFPKYLPHILCGKDPAFMLEIYDALNRKLTEYTIWEQDLMKCISELKLHKETDYTEISNHLTMWEELSFNDKRQTVDQLIRVIYATSDSIKIEWRI